MGQRHQPPYADRWDIRQWISPDIIMGIFFYACELFVMVLPFTGRFELYGTESYDLGNHLASYFATCCWSCFSQRCIKYRHAV